MRWTHACAALAALACAGPARGEGQLESRLKPWVAGFLERAGIPSGAVAVVEKDRVLFLDGFGRSTAGDAGVTPDSRFYIGSCTKTLTALAVVQLADRGQIGLEERFTRYLPEFDLGDPARARALEVRHLLSHTSGIGTRSAFDAEAQWQGRLDHLDFDHPPGEVVDYSSLNFLLLGRLIERVSGRPYAEYMREEVFTPLGMERTTAVRDEAEADGLVQGHSYFFGLTLPRREPSYAPLMVPTGYAVSTARDLAGYLGFLLDPERQEQLGVLSPRAVERMLSPWDGARTGAALGWGVGTWRGERRIGHAGMTAGFAARLALLPDRGIGVATLIARNAGPFLPSDAALLEGVLLHVAGDASAAPVPREQWVRLAFLVLALWTLFSAGRELQRFGAAGWPLRVPRRTGVWAWALCKIALHLGGALWILHSFAQISLLGLLEFYPDLGLLLVAGVALGSAEAVLVALRRAVG